MKLFYPEACADAPIHKAFQYRYPQTHKNKSGKLFQNIEYRFFEQVETAIPEEASASVLVNDFIKEPSAMVREYIAREADRAETLGIPLFLFSCGDFSDAIHFDPRAWVFRCSLYKSRKGIRDLCIPMGTEDPPAELLYLRPKTEKPQVAFCGAGGFRSIRWAVLYTLKNAWYECAAWISAPLRARKLGVYWRRAMMRACERSTCVDSHFIVRNSFSGHAKSIELDPAQARKEYLETTAHADFVLAPKGDGNYSIRFFKTLAFGRIPVVVDTDIVLPLEEYIDYGAIMVRVSMQEVTQAPKLIRAWYDELTSEEWEERQKLARETFLTRLRVDSFYRFFFDTVFPTLSV